MTETFQQKVEAQVIGIGRSNIPEPEKQLLRLLYRSWQDPTGGRMTQEQLAKAMYEVDVSNESLHRQVRQIVRDLRTERWAPILSDRDGYWIPKKEAECRDYLGRLEHEVRARMYASWETYKAMRESLGITSDFFEGQGRLMETTMKVTVPSATQKGKGWEVYRVAGQGFICTCPGYRYRKTCRHVDEAAKRDAGTA
jgi:hypothetical protein